MVETWDSIADWYSALVRGGSAMHEFSRDILLSAVPPTLTGARVLDVGCGEGLVTRALAARGATVLGVDPTSALIAHAQAAEKAHPSGATFRRDDGSTLSSVNSDTMDWVTAALSLNNIADLDSAISSIKRVLKSEGRLVLTIPHPCFDAPNAGSLAVDGTHRRVVGDYLAQGFWRSTHPDSVRRAGNYHRSIATYLTALIDRGFTVEVIAEPVPSRRVNETNPHRAGLPPFFLTRAVVSKGTDVIRSHT